MTRPADDVVLACEHAVIRALAVSGKTIRNRSRERRGLYQDVPDERLYLEMDHDDAEIERLSMDHWHILKVVIAPTIGAPAACLIAQVCDDYVTDLMRTRTPHTIARLVHALKPVAELTWNPRRRLGRCISADQLALFGIDDAAAAE